MKKIGLLCLALVLALGALGVGYAMWQDTVTIEGTVNTGSVDLDIVELSSTWVYKVPGEDPEIVVNHARIPGIHATADPNAPANGILVASATADIVSLTDYADNIVTVTCTNLFPCVDFKVDFLIHYDGSVPAKLNITDPLFTGTDADFFNELVWSLPTGDPEDSYCYGEMWKSDAAGVIGENIPDLEGYQLHKCDYILIVITLHLGQGAPMNAEASFTSAINAIQWNEYGEPV